MRKTPQNLLQGQSGVYRVASILCLRGLNPYFPAVDDGADLLVSGCRIQVKCAHLRRDKVYPLGAYWFKLGRTTIKERKQVWENVTFSEFCDFVVFWGIEHDKFWIVPASDLNEHQCLTLGPQNITRGLPHKIRSLENRWDLIDEFLGIVFDTQEPKILDFNKETSNALLK